jgi:site-specific DNA recombinase
VICEDIERSGRDTFNALKLERHLADAGIPLFAADEPIDVEGMNATTILVRRVKQGIAEWYRFQIKEKAWKGLREHALDGWNIGPAPYGYQPERIPHPVPVKAAQGRTKTRLVPDPERAPVVAQIYTWRTVDRLGVPEIAGRLNADHDACPPPDPATGWTASGVHSILSNPKYTGHMVFGRRRTQAGRRGQPVPT